MKIGYARVLAYGQSLGNQPDALHKAGCKRFFHKKASGAKENHKELIVMTNFARGGDQIIVPKPDRLSRSLFEFQKFARTPEEKKIDLMVPERQIDTPAPHGRLLFNIAGVFAKFERETINERTAEGQKSAKERGVKFDKPKKLIGKDVESRLSLIAMSTSKPKITDMFGIVGTSIFQHLQDNGCKSNRNKK